MVAEYSEGLMFPSVSVKLATVLRNGWTCGEVIGTVNELAVRAIGLLGGEVVVGETESGTTMIGAVYAAAPEPNVMLPTVGRSRGEGGGWSWIWHTNGLDDNSLTQSGLSIKPVPSADRCMIVGTK
jgi:hypothetical protein